MSQRVLYVLLWHCLEKTFSMQKLFTIRSNVVHGIDFNEICYLKTNICSTWIHWNHYFPLKLGKCCANVAQHFQNVVPELCLIINERWILPVWKHSTNIMPHISIILTQHLHYVVLMFSQMLSECLKLSTERCSTNIWYNISAMFT